MKKIIPCLDTRDGRLVKGVNFENVKELGDPIEFAKQYDEQGADELVVLDITKTLDGHELRTQMIQEIVSNITIPLTVGGGIASLDDIEAVLGAGASAVGINSAAIRNPQLINEAAAQFGSERIVIAVDMAYDEAEADYFVYTQAGQQKEAVRAFDWLEECENRGAGRLLITSIDHDGVKGGFDIDFLKLAAERVNIPIIASGGAGRAEDFLSLFKETQVEAGLAASIFHQGEVNIKALKEMLKAEGIDVNIDRN